MSRPQMFYTAPEIGRMLNISPSFVRREIIAGRLKAVQNTPKKGGGPRRHYVQRSDLVGWLLAGGYDIRNLRALLNGAGGAEVVLVRTRPSLQGAFMRRDLTILADSMFDLGQKLFDRHVWAAVIDLAEVGAAEATRSLTALSQRVDRPVLVGLYNDEYTTRPASGDVFDLLLPLSRCDRDLAAAITNLARGRQ